MAMSSPASDLQRAQAQRPAEAPDTSRADAARARVVAPAPPPAVVEEQRPSPATGALLIPAGQPLPPARRLVVLVPDVEVDVAQLASRIWSLASPRGLEVLFLGLTSQPFEEHSARRRLVTLAAITRDDWAHVDIRLEYGQDWIQALQHVWKAGDLIVCHAEQGLPPWSLSRKPLAQTLVSALQAPVYVLAGFYPELLSAQPNPMAWLLAWLPPLSVLVIFFALQVQVVRATTGWAQTVLLCVSMGGEFSLIWAWNQFLS